MKSLKSNEGNVSILFCVMITVILGFAAFTVDIGNVYIERVKLSNAIDAAALAASLELPDNRDKARTVASDYLQKNNVNPNLTTIIFGADNKSIQIQGSKNVKHIFAQIIGINSSNINSKTKAIIAPAKAVYGGLRPVAVEAFEYTYGDVVTLKQGAGDGYHGNYNPVQLGGSGASVFEQNAIYGYKGKISIGDYIDTEPGNMAGASSDIQRYIATESSTFNSFTRNSIRLWTIPLVDTLLVNGQKSVQVVGFGMFYVEDANNKAGKLEFTGRFVKYVAASEIDVNVIDTGVYGVKLSN